MGNQESTPRLIGDFMHIFLGKNLIEISDEKKRVKLNIIKTTVKIKLYKKKIKNHMKLHLNIINRLLSMNYTQASKLIVIYMLNSKRNKLFLNLITLQMKRGMIVKQIRRIMKIRKFLLYVLNFAIFCVRLLILNIAKRT